MKSFLIGKILLKKFYKDYEKNKLSMLFKAFSLAYLIFLFLFLGVTLSRTLKSDLLGYFVGSYFIFDFTIRIFFQNVRAEPLQFIFLPIRRSSLVHITLIRNIFNFFNLIPLLVFTPTIIFQVKDPYIQVLLLFMLILFVNWTIMLLKIRGNIIIKLLVIILIYIGGGGIVIWGESLIESVRSYEEGVLFLSGIILNIFIYYVLFKFVEKRILMLRNGSFIESIVSIDSFNLFEDLLSLEIKLIMRNKRPLTYILGSSMLVILFGQMSFFSTEEISLSTVLAFSAISIVVPLFYAQYLFSWESEYFGFILTNTRAAQYIKSKFNLLTILFILNGVCLTPLILTYSFNYYLLPIWVFQMGSTPILFSIVSFNNDRGLKLAKGSLLNYEGTTLNTFILILLGPLLPVVIYIPFHLLGVRDIGLVTLAMVGIVAFLSKNMLVDLVAINFKRKRYSMYYGFRFN